MDWKKWFKQWGFLPTVRIKVLHVGEKYTREEMQSAENFYQAIKARLITELGLTEPVDKG